MTQASQFLEAWHTMTYTIDVVRLAKRLEPKVKAQRKTWPPTGTTLTFPDGSIICTRGTPIFTGINLHVYQNLPASPRLFSLATNAS